MSVDQYQRTRHPNLLRCQPGGGQRTQFGQLKRRKFIKLPPQERGDGYRQAAQEQIEQKKLL
jgi:hypothetical protein